MQEEIALELLRKAIEEKAGRSSNSKDDGKLYDLNGRYLQGKPTKKGVYIQNGKKVVVR